MAIDTQNKRRSVLGQAIAPLTVFEVPDAAASGSDRRHRDALYSGIVTAVVPRFRWIAEQDTSSTYLCETDSSSPYLCEQDSSTTFVPETRQNEG